MEKLAIQLTPHTNIAVLCANGIGDALIFMTLAYQLKLNGYSVTLYSSAITALSDWFPEVNIEPITDNVSWNAYDYVFLEEHADVGSRFRGNDGKNFPKYITLSKRYFDRNQTLIDNLVRICKEDLHLHVKEKENGMTPPLKNVLHRKYSKRVIIHPFSHAAEKDWPLDKYIKLAKKLKQRHFEPVFIMSPKERELSFTKIPKEFEIPMFPSLNDTAIYIYESGFMIGNDSGIGHLASNLGLPTLSLFRVKSKAKLWRPGFGDNQYVTPWIRIPGPKFRRFWKQFLSVRRVLKRFLSMTAR